MLLARHRKHLACPGLHGPQEGLLQQALAIGKLHERLWIKFPGNRPQPSSCATCENNGNHPYLLKPYPAAIPQHQL